MLAEAKANSLESVNPNIPSLPASKQDSEASQKKNPLSVLSGAVVAGVIAAGLWLFTTKVEAVFDAQRLSTDYQVSQKELWSVIKRMFLKVQITPYVASFV